MLVAVEPAGSNSVSWILAGVAAAGAFVALLRWGRQDSRDAVEMASGNSETAMRLRDSAVAEAVSLRAQLVAVEAEKHRLEALLRKHGIDPEAAE